jgi:hypothetical protein
MPFFDIAYGLKWANPKGKPLRNTWLALELLTFFLQVFFKFESLNFSSCYIILVPLPYKTFARPLDAFCNKQTPLVSPH